MTQQKLQESIQRLSLEEKQQLYDWLSQEIEHDKQDRAIEPITKENRALVDQRKIGGLIYQLEMVKCGKPNCKCSRGQLHGPYWYAYQRQGDKLKSQYIGKVLKLPTEGKI